MWLNTRTEYSFGAVCGQISDVIKKSVKNKAKAIGIADFNSAWGHVAFEKECNKQGIKPVFGVVIPVYDRLDVKEKRYYFDNFTLIALTNDGLKSIYYLVDKSFSKSNFYYQPRITYDDLNLLSENDVALIATYSPCVKRIKRHFYLALMPSTPYSIRNLKADYIACIDNYFINKKDVKVYELFADERKRERKSSPMHILTDDEWIELFPDNKEALKNRNKVLKKANVTLSKAPMIKAKSKTSLKKLCKEGALNKGIDLEKEPYKSRLKKELNLIESKEFTDYFLVVADLVKYAKKEMVVGHARGSSAGSLVCYLIGITEINPLEYGLVFERFIDINRKDLPDIDIDFQDDKRHLVIKYLQKKYGLSNVAQIGNISKLKPKSSLIRISKALSIPPWEIEELKESIVERASGDERANQCIEDAIKTTEIGKVFIKKHKNMKPVIKIEGHVSHSSVHAAGVIVCNDAITNYCGINSRDNNVAMIDKDDAEYLNLLKIDILGLRTLTILAEICNIIGKPYEWLYDLPVNDKKTFKTLNKQRLTGVFQFEGDSIRRLAKRMKIKNIFDISALTSICRPGPMIVGAAEQYVKRNEGKEEVVYIGESDVVKEITKETLGLVIYQEQVMNILKEYAGLSWEDVTILRKAMAKSKGDESFAEYKTKFIKGAKKQGNKKENADEVWNTIKAMGQYSFNKSHAIAYSVLTYLCAYLKTYYPLEFAVASLNNVKDNRSAIKLLRDLRENENIEHVYYDKKYSDVRWTVRKGKLIASLQTIEGIAEIGAKKIVSLRNSNQQIPAGLMKHLDAMKTPFKYIYPAKQIYGDYYLDPRKHGIKNTMIVEIEKLEKSNDVCIIGVLTKKLMRDMNEPQLLSKRGNSIYEGDTTFVSLGFEDDTGNVNAILGSQLYPEFAEEIEKAKVDVDWFLIFGKYNPQFNNIFIENIKLITREV